MTALLMIGMPKRKRMMEKVTEVPSKDKRSQLRSLAHMRQEITRKDDPMIVWGISALDLLGLLDYIDMLESQIGKS